MGKLLKYEFIKNRVILLVCLGAYLLDSLILVLGGLYENEALIGTSIVLSFFVVCGTFLSPIIIGITNYVRELSGKVGYLIFMTPNSTYTIVGAKFIFTLLVELFFSVATVLFYFVDYSVIDFLNKDMENTLSFVRDIMGIFGFDTRAIIAKILIFVGSTLIYLLVFSALFYAVYTLTFFTVICKNSSKFWIAFLLYIVLLVVYVRVGLIIPEGHGDTFLQNLLAEWPFYLYNIAICTASYFSCAFMLDKKLNL